MTYNEKEQLLVNCHTFPFLTGKICVDLIIANPNAVFQREADISNNML